MLRCSEELNIIKFAKAYQIESRAAWLARSLARLPAHSSFPLLWRRIKNQILCLTKNFSFKFNKQTNKQTKERI